VTSTTPDGLYGASSVINVTVNFDLPVTVSGTPQIALNSGGTAFYTGGSGTSSLTFSYTVAAGESSPDLDYTSVTALTNGAISNKSVTSVLANLTLPTPGGAGSLGFNRNIVIDAVAPTVSQYLVVYGTNNLTYDLANLPPGRTILPWLVKGIKVAFSEPITTGNLASLAGITATGFAGLGTATLTWSFPALSDGSYFTQVLGTGASALKDAAGNPLGGGVNDTRMFDVLYGDVNGDGIVNAGDMAVVSANASSPNVFFAFADVNGDGSVNINDYSQVRRRIGRTLPAPS
jgi:hypothetical protein